jgi:hypothetical protein
VHIQLCSLELKCKSLCSFAHCKVSENSKRHSHLSVGVRGTIDVEIVDNLTNPLESHNHLIFYSEIYQHHKEYKKLEKLFISLITEFDHNHYVAAVGLFLQLRGKAKRIHGKRRH